MKRTISHTTVAAALLLVMGCSSIPDRPTHDPAFTPVYPVAPPERAQNNGAIFNDGNNGLLFEDTKAHKIGDLLTVQLQESTNASKSNNTSTGKSSNLEMGANASLFGAPVTWNGQSILNNQLSGSSDFSGTGTSKQSNSLTGSITVTVVDVMANGNLFVRGEKVMRLDQGDEFVRLAGIVRPADIGVNNSVASYKIANAEIIVGGNGMIADAGHAGWLTRFFNSPIWPF